MRRSLVFFAAASALLFQPSVVSAQMAGALGKPLPVSNMDTGSVTVRVIAGAPDKPVVGVPAQLVMPGGTTLTARTDAEGRATFAGLTPGTSYIARAQEPTDATDASDPREATSEQFTIPPEGGIRLMISTRPWQGGGAAGGPPMAGGGPMGAMDPRQMSGIPRGDPSVVAGTMTVAVVRDTVANRLSDHTVHLIGYSHDGSITRQTAKSDSTGRATFDGLQPRTHAYYAMTAFERSDGTMDRVISDPVTMPPRVGIRMLLAGSPSDGSGPRIDDLAFIANQSARVGPREILAQFWYRDQNQAPQSASLYSIEESGPPQLVESAPLTAPRPADIRAEFSTPAPAADLVPGILAFTILDVNQQMAPLPGIAVKLVAISPAADAATDATTPPAANELTSITDAQGTAVFTGLTPGRAYRAVLTLYERDFESAPLVVSADTGMRAQATVSARFDSSAEVRFDGAVPGKVYFVQGDYAGRSQRTRPFLVVADRGAVVGLPLYDKPLLSFHYIGWVDDEYMGFQGQLGLLNMAPEPWNPGPNGLMIPLPEGFIGGQVDDEFSERVKVVPGEGLLWRDLMPPGRISFRMGFSLHVEDGATRFALDLPLGVFQGSMIIIKNAGMELVGVPKQLNPIARPARDGRDIFEISDISYQSGGRLAFQITGLPQRPRTEKYITWAVGIIVLIFIGWALQQLFTNPRRDAEARGKDDAESARLRKLQQKREALLEELVELEAKKRKKDIGGEAYERARGKLQKKLETTYAEIEKLEEKGVYSAA